MPGASSSHRVKLHFFTAGSWESLRSIHLRDMSATAASQLSSTFSSEFCDSTRCPEFARYSREGVIYDGRQRRQRYFVDSPKGEVRVRLTDLPLTRAAPSHASAEATRQLPRPKIQLGGCELQLPRRRGAAQHEARKRRASERRRVGCSGELDAAALPAKLKV
jgi:hypothetical protein